MFMLCCISYIFFDLKIFVSLKIIREEVRFKLNIMFYILLVYLVSIDLFVRLVFLKRLF